MDNLTHSLVGLAAAKAGLERLSPGATAVCVLAANAPDLDILAALGGKWFYLHHHRGITHSFVGTLTLALLIPCLFYVVDRLIARLRKREPRVRFVGLLIASLIVSASHPLMDWTNNYGVRPFLPWSGDWYYGDLVFIIDPWIWMAVGGAAFLLTSKKTWQAIFWSTLALILTILIFSMRLENAGLLYPNLFRALWIAGIVALVVVRWTRLVQPWGSKVALVALALVLVYWGGLAVAHRSAFSEAQAIAQKLSVERGETLGRVAAMPVLADPFRWLCVADTERATYRFLLSLTGGEDKLTGEVARFEKPQGAEAVAAKRASKDERAQIFLSFARFPASSVEGDCLSELLVQFADIRYTEPGALRRGTFSLEVPVTCDAEMVNEK
ncbi:MAG: inner membrane protein [Acidobacteriota bacterium]|jgi:inner membrane protein|nr:inner membrane protein [Acidobacteriota bacterium]